MPIKPTTSRLMVITEGDLPPAILNDLVVFLAEKGVRAGVMLSWDNYSQAVLDLIAACYGFIAFHPGECPDPDCPAIAARAALRAVGHDPDDEGIHLNWPGQ
jgi:hypothetical protein